MAQPTQHLIYNITAKRFVILSVTECFFFAKLTRHFNNDKIGITVRYSNRIAFLAGLIWIPQI